jgi:hypothetical protein
VRFAYMDESGNTGRNLDDPIQAIHLILSAVIDEASVSPLHEHMRDVARVHCPQSRRHESFEFHGPDMHAARGHFEGRTPLERIEIYDDVLRGIELAGAEIIIRGVHKPGLMRRYPTPYHPHDIALMFTIESVERLARERDCRVLLVADEAREVESAALRDLANYQEFGTSWGWKTAQIDRVIDTIHFVRSETNPAIQLADCAAFIASRMRKIEAGTVAEDRSSEAIERLWNERIEPFVCENSIWYPT